MKKAKKKRMTRKKTTFRQFIAEQDPGYRKTRRDLRDFVFSERLERPRYYIPVTDQLADEARGGPHFTTAFHILSIESIAFLIGLQNSTKSVSASLHPEYEEALNGVLPGHGGAVAKVYGHALVDAPFDVYSKQDQNGIRWVDIGQMADLARAIGDTKLIAQLTKLMTSMDEMRRSVAAELLGMDTIKAIIKQFRTEYLSPYDIDRANEFLMPLYSKNAPGDVLWSRLSVVVRAATKSGWKIPEVLYERYLEGLQGVLHGNHDVRDGVIDLRNSVGERLINGHDEIIMDQIQIKAFLIIGPEAIIKYRTLGYHQRFKTTLVQYPVEPGSRAIFNSFLSN